MDMIITNEFAFLLLLAGIPTIITCIIYKVRPPKKMTWYNMIPSKIDLHHEDAWREAIRFTVKAGIILGVFFITIGLLPFIFPDSNFFTFRSATLLIIYSCLVIFLLRERHLKSLFDENGDKQQKV